MAATAIAELLRPLGLEDFLSLPDGPERYEILDGELIVTPVPVPQHEDVLQAINFAFESVVRVQRLGKVYTAPVGVRLTPHDIVQPDIVVVLGNERRSIVRGGVIAGVPDVVVEVLSPSTRRHDLVRKMALYLRAGVREYWIADPEERTIAVYALVDGRYVALPNEQGIARSRVVAGVEVDVAALFADVWP